MLKETIEYVDYNGEERKEEFYFNLSQRELELWDLSTPGGIAAKYQRIIDKKDGKDIIAAFYELLEKSYGEKSDDGRHFIKKRNGVSLFEEFEQSPAFDALYEKLCTDAKYASRFFTGLIPADLSNKVRESNPNIITG